MSRTHYSTLGVEPAAGRDAIKIAYYDLRKQFSALKRPTDAQKERLVRINAAWDVLKLADRRREYDGELGLGGDAGREPDAEAAHQEALRRTAEARKAASDAAAAAAEQRNAEAAAERMARGRRTASPASTREPSSRAKVGKVGPPGGARYWALGAGFAVAYLALSAAVHRPQPPSPAPLPKFIEEVVPRNEAKASRPARGHPLRKRHSAHGRRSTQTAADLNRLELQRLRSNGAASVSSGPATKSNAIDRDDQFLDP